MRRPDLRNALYHVVSFFVFWFKNHFKDEKLLKDIQTLAYHNAPNTTDELYPRWKDADEIVRLMRERDRPPFFTGDPAEDERQANKHKRAGRVKYLKALHDYWMDWYVHEPVDQAALARLGVSDTVPARRRRTDDFD